MEVSQNCVNLVKEFEGLHTKIGGNRVKAYLDTLVSPKYRSPGVRGLWTVGFGSTGLDYRGHRIDGNTVWTYAEAEEDLRHRLNKKALSVQKMVNVELNQNQFDALVSWLYNLGEGNFAGSTLQKKINAEDWEGARKAFALYNKAGGKVYRGLVRRRAAEAALFAKPVSTVVAKKPATEVTKEVVKEVVKNSAKLRFLKDLRLWLMTLSIPGFITWENFDLVRDAVKDHAGAVVLGVGIALWLIAKWVEHKSVKDYVDGRYVPSGMADEPFELPEETEEDEDYATARLA